MDTLACCSFAADADKAQGTKFDQQRFHDFILAQGLLPPALLRKAVYDQYLYTAHSGSH
jgi:uncharacterized protein (DUF885 family)